MDTKYFDFNKIFDNTKLKTYIDNTCNNIINNIKKNHKKLKWIIPYISYFNTNYYLFFIIISILIIIFSKIFLNFFFILLLIDSTILSVIIMHKNYNYSRKLAKNIILLFILYLNIFGSIITLLLFSFLYLEFSKYVNRIIYKIVETVFCFLHTNLSIISLIYPNINNIKYNKPIESTENVSSSSE